MMKRKIPALAAAIALAACVFANTGTANAAGGAPGSADDPVVSKSYVDEKDGQLQQQINALAGTDLSGAGLPAAGISDADRNRIIDEVLAYIAYNGGSDGAQVFQPVFFTKGSAVIGEAGTEMILRSGDASAYCSGPDGLTDVTAGTDVTHGKTVSYNHLLIVPRDDGRGLFFAADSWVMVKGPYSLMN